jgi:uncharacterized protein with ATP-grasp and redox domains
MKIQTPCITCFIRQAERIIQKYVPGRERRIELLQKAMEQGKHFHPDMIPLELSPYVYGMLKKELGENDLYFEEKRKTNTAALELVPLIRKLIRESDFPLYTALHLSIIGNIIDFSQEGVGEMDLEQFVMDFVKKPFIRDDASSFFQELEEASLFVFLTDNSGEAVFDKIFLEEIKKEYSHLEIVIGGKEEPVLNDVTSDELKELGFEEIGRVVSTGSTLPGNIETKYSSDFEKIWRRADVVMVKGQGNFEGLSSSTRSVYFGFMAKCPVLASFLEVPDKSLLFMKKD